MTFWDHLDVFRGTLWRCVCVSALVAVALFVCKEQVFDLVLAPCSADFVTYRWIDDFVYYVSGIQKNLFTDFHLRLISTELSAQFTAHLQIAVGGGLLLAMPYLLWQLFRFIAPALYSNELKFVKIVFPITFFLFLLGILCNYYLLFPVALHFLGSYQVSPEVESTITLSSYISTLTSLTLVMGCVFELPVALWLLARNELITTATLKQYRRHAFVIILILSAIITPPDILTMLLVTMPLYLLYEISIHVIESTSLRKTQFIVKSGE